MTVDAILVRRSEAFFGRDVGLAIDAITRGGASTGPEVLIGEADGEVGAAIGRAEAERVIALAVEEVDAMLEVGAVFAPGLNRVAGGDARGSEDGIPELVHGELF